MSKVVIVISDPNASITELNTKLGNSSTAEKNQLINNLINYLSRASVGGITGGDIEITTRDTDPVISTSGTGSQKVKVKHG